MTVLNNLLSTTINNKGSHELQYIFRQLERAKIFKNSYFGLNQLTATKTSKLENASIVIILASTFIFAVLSLLQTFLEISAEVVFIAKSTLLFGALVFLVLLVGMNIVNFWRKLRKFPQRSIKRAKEDAIITRRAIFQLGNVTDRSDLKYAESHFKLLILEAQDKTKTILLFLATIAFVLLILYAWGMSIQVLENQSPQSLIFELLGTLGVLIVVFWDLEVNLRSQILTYKRCLFVLRQAQLISTSLRKETANEPLAIKHKGEVIGYYYPKDVQKPEQHERDRKRLEKTLNRVLAETEVTEEEFAPLPRSNKALTYKDGN